MEFLRQASRARLRVLGLGSAALRVAVVVAYEDDAFDAWTVLNRIQENVVRGNVMVRSITDRSQGERKARPIASIQEHVRVNQQLFDMVV